MQGLVRTHFTRKEGSRVGERESVEMLETVETIENCRKYRRKTAPFQNKMVVQIFLYTFQHFSTVSTVWVRADWDWCETVEVTFNTFLQFAIDGVLPCEKPC